MSDPTSEADTVKISDLSPEAQAALAKVWVRDVKDDLAKETAARAEAEANGTVSEFDVPIDQRGHHFTTFTVTSRGILDYWLKDSAKPVITARQALPGLPGADTTDENGDCTILTVASNADMNRPCYWCNEDAVATYDGTVVRATTECPYPDGFTTTVDLVVTSAKIVVAWNLSTAFRVDEEHATFNAAWGKSAYTKAMADLGCAFAYVGDHGPSLYRTGKDTYAIAADGTTDNYETIPFEGESLTEVLLDSRSYAIADHDGYLTKGGIINDDTEVVEVPNGVYTFAFHGDEKDFDYDSRAVKVFTTITRADLP